MKLHENIRALIDAEMASKGISLNAIALAMGMKQPTLYRIYKGESRDPSRDHILKIARYFGIKAPDDLYRRNLLPSSSSTQHNDGVELILPPRIGLKELDGAVSAVLATHGWTLDEYLAASRRKTPGTKSWEDGDVVETAGSDGQKKAGS